MNFMIQLTWMVTKDQRVKPDQNMNQEEKAAATVEKNQTQVPIQPSRWVLGR
ncbi:hypothetical protein D3C85_1695830 [compost metagenome]